MLLLGPLLRGTLKGKRFFFGTFSPMYVYLHLIVAVGDLGWVTL